MQEVAESGHMEGIERGAFGRTYPSSKCLQRFNANCAFVLQAVHSSLNTTFFVVFAFLWNTGFV